jgi:hypothetical protein
MIHGRDATVKVTGLNRSPILSRNRISDADIHRKVTVSIAEIAKTSIITVFIDKD